MEKFDWLQAFAAEQQEQPEPGVSADAAPEDVQERAEAFRALIQGPYKKDYDRQVQMIVRERLKNCARSEQVLKSLGPALEKTFGVDAAQLTPEQASVSVWLGSRLQVRVWVLFPLDVQSFQS